MVLVRERQRHPVTENLLHVDFLEVSMTERLRVTVPLQFTGDAPAVKLYNGIVIPSRETLEIECLPNDLPNLIEVNLSGLGEIGDVLYVRDIQSVSPCSMTPTRLSLLSLLRKAKLLWTPPSARSSRK
jgi:large subunit ribosomal protein L25